MYARLANHVGLEGGVEGLGSLRGHYEPRERTLLTDVEILELLDALRGTRWFCSMAAMATYGSRPAEVPSLQLNADATASRLSIKRKDRQPVQRTVFALPGAWVEQFNLHCMEIPGDVRWCRPDE